MGDERAISREPSRARASLPAALSSFLVIVVGFTLTSTAYIAWLYRLMEFVPPGVADALTLIGGYGMHALGIGIVALIGRRWPGVFSRSLFVLIVALHFACAVPAIMGQSFAGVLVFGYLMNVLCGAIAAYYLHSLMDRVAARRRGIVFGGGYAVSILISWLTRSIPVGSGDAVGSLILCLVFSAIAAIAAFLPIGRAGAVPKLDEPPDRSATQPPTSVFRYSYKTITALACFAVLLMSLVKNVGFSFPTADIAAGVNLELSRLFYAAGLVIAGIVSDRSRRSGAICCVAALITPFICMALANEPLPGTAMWAIDYFFFGFFSVFRVVLFSDIAASSERPYLSGFGLMVGRIGDALGTAVCLTLGDSAVALVAVAGVLFAAAIFVVHRLFQMVFMPEPAPVKSGEQIFEEFCVSYELSMREREVMKLLLTELSNTEIASELFVTESTVKFHVHNILKKTDCKNRQELRATYARFAR